MQPKTLTGLAILVTSILLAPRSAVAHDDGLTCHDHPSSSGTMGWDNTKHVKWTSPDLGRGSTSIGVLAHSVDNHVAKDHDRYVSEEVVATHASLGELEEMVDAVRLLVTRAERIVEPIEAARALELAADTLGKLPLTEYLTIDDFLEENRDLSAIVVPLDVVLQYLRDVGTPDDLVAAVEDSAAGC